MDLHKLMDRLNLSIEETQSLNPVVLSIAVELDNQLKKLEIHRFDDPFIISTKFCKENDLSMEHRDLIEKEILQQLQKQTQLKEQQVKTTNVKKSNTPLKKSVHKSPISRPKRKAETVSFLQKQNQRQRRECSFKPKINEVSALLAQNRTDTRKDKSKLMQDIKKAKQKQQRQCTFKPKLNVKSKIIAIKPNSLSVFQTLYRKGLDNIQSRQMQKTPEQCTFKPQINTITFSTPKQPKHSNLKESKQNCTFRPQINRINIQYNPQGMDKWTFLQRKLSKSIMVSKQEQSNPNIPFKDCQILDELGLRIGRKIFERLRGNFEEIDSYNMNIEGIPTDLLKLMKKFLVEIEELNIKVNKQVFSKAFCLFFQQLDLNGRNSFIKFLKSASQLNLNKKTIPQSLRNQKLSRLYEQGLQKLRLREKLHTEEQSRKMVQELRDCTFKPLIKGGVEWYQQQQGTDN